ncbi:MAG: MMPL family transporter, partial [Clostridia bacterium]|nr:MMPL family transporter [Clostridia bacterium]
MILNKTNIMAKWITRHPKTVMLIALILLVPSLFGFLLTGVNYDILSYLPSDINSVEGEQILDETFQSASSVILVIEDFDAKEVQQVKKQISEIDGVTKVIWSDNILDTTVPQSAMPSALRKIFYSNDGTATLLLINLDCNSSSDRATEAIKSIRSIMNKKCFISGMSAIMADTKALTVSEAPIYISFAIALALIVMSFTMDSWVLPFVLLASLGMAVLYNMGTNFMFGEI